MTRRLPFDIDRESSVTLTEQIVDGFRRAIDCGIYRPGDVLPTMREVVGATGASLIVVRAAFRRLAREGLVLPRRRVGSVVLGPTAGAWRGHVVISSIEIRENHLLSAMTGTLRQMLMKAGYMVSFVPIGAGCGTYDFGHLDSVLRGPVTLVVSTDSSKIVATRLLASGIPFVTFGQCHGASASFSLDCSTALVEFARHCRATGVKKVVEVLVGSDLADAGDAMKAVGIKLKRWHIVRKGNIEDISRATLKAIYSKMRRHGKKWLPDVLYFNDNFASQSALLALVDSGVDIPQDVKLVTWSNAGEGPFWRKSIARVEINPFEAGRIFAKHILSYLNGRRARTHASASPRYIRGETFSTS